jgi:hypothetical protein
MEERAIVAEIDLAPNAADVNIYDVRHGIEVEVPDMLKQHRPRNDVPLVANHEFKQAEFAGQQGDIAAASPRSPCEKVKLQISDAEHGLLDNAFAPARERLDARQQFSKGEGLDEIVVAAGPQAANAIIDFPQRADDQDRRIPPLLSQAPDNYNPVAVWKQTIDNDHPILYGSRFALATGEVSGDVDAVAKGLQGVDELLGHLDVVFDDENRAQSVRHDRASW